MVFLCICLKMACKSEVAGCRAKLSELCMGLGDTSNTYMGTFDLVVCNVILSQLVHLSQNGLQLGEFKCVPCFDQTSKWPLH